MSFTDSGPKLLFDLFYKWNISNQQEGISFRDYVPSFRTPQEFLSNLNWKITAAFHLVRLLEFLLVDDLLSLLNLTIFCTSLTGCIFFAVHFTFAKR
jgi:hypothetical protein